MDDPTAESGWFDPNAQWRSSPSILPDLIQWELAAPLSSPTDLDGPSFAFPYNDRVSRDAVWPAAATVNSYIDVAAPIAVSFVNPQDTILHSEYGTARPTPIPLIAGYSAIKDEPTLLGSSNNKSRRDLRDPSEHQPSGTNSPNQSRVKKQRRARLPREATARFRAWFHDHRSYPYPNPDEVVVLSQETQTTTKQVKAWFSNFRTRLRHDSSSSIIDKVHAQRHQGLTTSALETWSRASGSSGSLDSVKRYLDISGEDLTSPRQPTAASVTAASTTDQETGSSVAEELPSWLVDGTARQHSTAPSVSGSDHHSVFSGMSHASMGSLVSRQTSFTSASASGSLRRRGKRRFDKHDSDASISSKKFPCTFCAKAFAAAYDWKRHEATHLPFVAQWICMPDETIVDEDGDCLFCFEPNVDEDHAKVHGVDSCRQKRVEQRTFGRKDQLKQHIEICHLTKAQRADSHMLKNFLDQWQRELELSWRNDEHKEALWCGFCCTHSHTWKERQDHVLEHLRNRCSMDNWHSYPRFIAYCKDKWDENLAATFQGYSQYVDHLITALKTEGGDHGG